MYHRLLNISNNNSFFLFGARGTGKSTYLKNIFNETNSTYIDLLNSDYYSRLQNRPSELIDILSSTDKAWCIIDEVQKIPEILDIVHLLIEKKSIKFGLTGSSARKLKRGNANLLAGRAFMNKLFPLTHFEIGDDFNLEDVLTYGALPKIYQFSDDNDKIRFLKSYCDAYLKEEVLIEQLIRNLPPFRKFLNISAHQDTEIVSYSSIARDILSDAKIVKNYYQILEDTLLGFFLEPYHTSIRKRQKKSPKFYFFDLGVKRCLSGNIENKVIPKTFEYGQLFENFIVNEIYRKLSYNEKSFQLSFIRIDDKIEIDLILERPGLPTYLIEIKSTEFINEAHLKSLKLIHPSIKNSIPIVVSQDRLKKKLENILCIPWPDMFQELGI